MLRRKALRGTSKKKQKVLRDEAKLMAEMVAQSDGCCWICGKYAALEPSHTKDRTRFIPSCRPCHSPNGVHKYLEVKE